MFEPLNLKALASLLATVVIAPLFITYLSIRPIGDQQINVLLLVTSACLVVYAVLFLQITSSNAYFENNRISITSMFYSYEFKIDESDTIEFTDTIEDARLLAYRSNGISLPGYKMGNFKTKRGDTVIALLTRPPYLVIDKEDMFIIISIKNEDIEIINEMRSAS